MRKQNKQIFKNISTKGSSKEAALCSLVRHSMETATFTRKETTCQGGNHLGCRRPAWELKLHRAGGSSRVVPVFAREWSTPTKAASEPPSHNYTTLERSPPLYLFIHVYTEVLGCTGTWPHGKVLALLFAASGRLDWGHTREKHHRKRHHKVFKKVNCLLPPPCPRRGGGTESLPSLARATDSKRVLPHVHLSISTPQGEREEADVVLLTAISFWLLEHISILKKEKGGPGLWKPSPSKKGRLWTKILC